MKRHCIIYECGFGAKLVRGGKNFERYARLIVSTSFNQLIDEEKSCRHVMQNNATAHTVNNVIEELDKISGERVVSQGLCPSRSFCHPCYFICGTW
jgi:hypothetical protein